MTDPTELDRVLEFLDHEARINPQRQHADAARVLRAMAADFETVSWHRPACRLGLLYGCTCGFDEARARWRLTK